MPDNIGNYLDFANQITGQWDPKRFFTLQDLAQRMQLQQQDIQAQNALREVMQQPGAVDPQTGQPTPQALKTMWGRSPKAAMDMSQNMLRTQNQQIQLQANQAKISEAARVRANEIALAAKDVYESTLNTQGPEAAQQKAQAVFDEQLPSLEQLAPKEQINRQFDYNRVLQNTHAYEVAHAKPIEPYQKEEIDIRRKQAEKPSVPKDIEYKTPSGETKTALAQQIPGTGQWVTADENRTPIEGTVQRIVPASAAGGAVLSDEAANTIAEQYVATGRMPTGFGRSQANQTKIWDAASKKMREQGLSGADIAARAADFQGVMAGEQSLGRRTALMGSAVNETRTFAPLALAASEKVDRTEYPTLNSLMLAYERGTGGKDVVDLAVYTQALLTAYARAVTPTGVPTEGAYNRRQEVLNTAYSKGQYATAVNDILQEMEAISKSVGMSRQELRGGIPGVAPAPGVQPQGAAPAAAPTGSTQSTDQWQQGPDGKWYHLSAGKDRSRKENWDGPHDAPPTRGGT